VRLWDSQIGTCLYTFEGNHSDLIANLTFSPDGQRLACVAWSDMTVHLWDIPTRKLLTTVKSDSFFMFFSDSSTFYAHVTKAGPRVSGLMKLKLNDQSLPPTEVPVCWFPSSWHITDVAFHSTCPLAAAGCASGRVYILDILAMLKDHD
jgi:WD40 repeat protein